MNLVANQREPQEVVEIEIELTTLPGVAVVAGLPVMKRTKKRKKRKKIQDQEMHL
jgi:hypothetical protein